MLSVSNLSRAHGGRTILSSISFVVNPGERIGLIGPNGAGKSTLLRMLAGVEESNSGSISVSPGERIGMLHQGFADLTEGTLADLLDGPTNGLASAARAIEQSLAGSDGSDAWLARYEIAHSAFELAGGYPVSSELEATLSSLGLGGRPWSTSLHDLSGGEKTRAGLAALIVSRPDYLLLDEPTNHLDVDGQRQLAELLLQFAGGILIVSHDRAFLDRVVTRILALDDQAEGIIAFAGTYSDFRVEQSRLAEAQAVAYRQQQEVIGRIRQDVRAVAAHAMETEKATQDDYLRGRSKKVARTAKVRERKLERLLASQNLIARPVRRWNMTAEFAPAADSGRDVVRLEHVSVGYGQAGLLIDVELLVRSGDRIAVTGPNGAGKTTLLKLIIGELRPDTGTVRIGANVRSGWFAQEQETLNPAQTPVQSIRTRSEMSEGEARAFLHKFLFTPANVTNPVSALSYGERSRLALAILVLEGCNLLLLDEPLNHLDITSREQFEAALTEFTGTLLIVLHDVYSAGRICNRFLRVGNGRVVEEFR